MTHNAPLQNISTEIDSPHDTTRKPLDRRHRVRTSPDAELQQLRTLCHYQGMLLDLLSERAGHGNA